MTRINFNFNARVAAAAFAAVATLVAAQVSEAKHGRYTTVSGQAAVSVWIDGGDVFPDYRDVTVWLRPERDCFTTLFLVDTDGYIHVLYPHAACDDSWVRGGSTYCYRACDLGLDRLDGCGIAYVFAVGSPSPFDYSAYGDRIFVGGFGFRITGDPFDGCRDFYASILPASCRWDYVGVGYARFYVREWVRYPSYLCAGGHGFHVRIGDGCRICDDVYGSYRAHVAAPYEAIRPVPRFKSTYATGHVTDRERSNRVAEPPVVVARKTVYRDYHAGPTARVVSTSRRHASETELRPDRSGATGAVSRDSAGHSRQQMTADRSPASAKSGQAKSASREKGAKKKVRQAQ